MADHTKIEWTEATWNPITGCSVHSAGCTNCYAMKWAGTRLRHHPSRAGLTIDTKAGPVWNGEVRFNEEWLTQPLQWKRPRMIFVCAHADLFHESVPDEWIDRIFAVMALCPQHTFQVLTKRSDRMRAYMDLACGRIADQVMKLRHTDAAKRAGMGPSAIAPLPHVAIGASWWPLPNVWLGVSVENQAAADERIPDLLATSAAVRWLSCEPLLGPVDLRWIAEPDEEKDGVIDALLGCNWVDGSIYDRGEEFRPARPGHEDRIMRRWVCSPESDILANRKIDWVAVGGESGKDARPMHPDWARSLRDQCEAAGTAYFFKQWGAFKPYENESGIDGAWLDPSGHFYGGPETGFPPQPSERRAFVCRFGKKAAGRLLDGKLHDAMPQIGGVA